MNDDSNMSQESVSHTRMHRTDYIVPDSALSAAQIHRNLLADYPVRYLGTQQVLDHYFDDDKHSLYQQGYSCCLREAGDKLALCLIPVDDLGMGRTTANTLILDLPGDDYFCELNSAELPEGELRDQLQQLMGATAAAPLFRARTYRRHYQVDFNGVVRYATLDVIDVCFNRRNNKAVPGLNYTEMSLMSDPARRSEAEHFESALVEQFHLAHSASNLFRRTLHHDGSLMELYMRNRENNKNNDASEDSIEQRVFGENLLDKLSQIEYYRAVAAEGVDIEGVHQMRVNIRRIRSALSLFSPLLDEDAADHWQEEFRWLSKRLGNVRDADVLLEWLEEHKESSDEKDAANYQMYQDDIHRLRNQARSALVNGLESERYRTLINGFRSWLQTDSCLRPTKGFNYADASELAEKLLRRTLRRTARRISEVQKDSHAEALHAVRIQSKRLRYAIDMLSDLSSHSYKSARNVCKDLQTVLGEHQDACDSTRRIQAYALSRAAGDHGQEYIFFLGRLFAAQDQRIKVYRGKFFDIQKQSAKTLREYR